MTGMRDTPSITEGATAEEPVVVYESRPSEEVTEAVVAALQSATKEDVAEKPPLYSAVDTDALERLFTVRRGRHQRQADGFITFEYGPYRIKVHSDHTIKIFDQG